MKPAKPATDEEFLRRAYLDLLGRIPNVQEARAFLQTREATSGRSWSSTCSSIPTTPRTSRTQWTILLIGRGNQGRMVDRGGA